MRGIQLVAIRILITHYMPLNPTHWTFIIKGRSFIWLFTWTCGYEKKMDVQWHTSFVEIAVH